MLKTFALFCLRWGNSICCWSISSSIDELSWLKKRFKIWRDGLAVKSTRCSSRGPRFDSQCPSSSSQLSVTLLLGDTAASYILFRHQAQKWHTDIWAGWKLKHIKQFLKILTNVLLSMASNFHSGCRHFTLEKVECFCCQREHTAEGFWS